MVVLVGRNEKMWQSIESGRLVSLSMLSFSPPLFSSSAMVVSFLERSLNQREKTKSVCLIFEEKTKGELLTV